MRRPLWLRQLVCSIRGHAIGKPFARGSVLVFYRCDRCTQPLMDHPDSRLGPLECTDEDVMEVLSSCSVWRRPTR